MAPGATGLTRGLHVAIIMDGNGRWARARGLPRTAGHREGGQAVRRVVRAAPGLGITTLTLYAFSADNWKRPTAEVAALMESFERYLVRTRERCAAQGVRVSVIGRRDRIAPRLVRAIHGTERATRRGAKLHLRIAVDYSSRHALCTAAALAPRPRTCSTAEFSRLLNRAVHSVSTTPDVDLLVRTGGEQRLSDFLLWESAYAELFFTDRLWPDFGAEDLFSAICEFQRRERRFGALAGTG